MTAVQASDPLTPALVTDAERGIAAAACRRAYEDVPGVDVFRITSDAALDAVAPLLHDRWVAEALERLAARWRPESDVRAAILANAAEYRATGPQARTEATT